jgi:hypothetical protein
MMPSTVGESTTRSPNLGVDSTETGCHKLLCAKIAGSTAMANTVCAEDGERCKSNAGTEIEEMGLGGIDKFIKQMADRIYKSYQKPN